MGFLTDVLKKKCLDLPAKVYQRRESRTNPEQKKVYKELKDVCDS